MDLELTDKVAWVLGASSGLGRAPALALASERASYVSGTTVMVDGGLLNGITA